MDTTLPLVSIACITYNHEKYIRQCLDGFVMQQTNFKFEIVIHDDASTDKTAEIIKEYCRKYPGLFKPILQDKNRYTEKKGILIPYVYPRCKGKYIALCEGDDYWIDPLKLQKQVDFLEENSEYSLIYSRAVVVDENSNSIKKSVSGITGNISKHLILKYNPIVTATVCYRKEYLQEYYKFYSVFNFKLKMGDYPLWVFLSLKGKFKYLADICAAYRVLENSASHSSNPQKALAFRFNRYQISVFMNDYYGMGLKKERILRNYMKERVKAVFSYDLKVFVKTYKEALIKCPWLLFDLKVQIMAMMKVFKIK